MGRADSDSSSDNTERTELSDDDSFEASLLYGSTDDTRLRTRKDMSVAQWHAASGTAEMVVKKGKAWTVTGFTRGSLHLTFIEEAVFMVEQGSLLLLEGEKVVPLLDAYSLVSSPMYGSSWANFQVYSYLKKLGYIVGRHNMSWTLPKKRPPVQAAGLENLTSHFAAVKVVEGAQKNDVTSNLFSQSLSHSTRTESEHLSSSDASCNFPSISKLEVKANDPSDFKLMYDVHTPNARFKKSNPGTPAFSLCSVSDHPPNRRRVRELEQSNEGIPVKFASVVCDDVTIYSFDAIELPTLL